MPPTDSGVGAVASRGHLGCVWLSSLSWGVLEGRARENEGAARVGAGEGGREREEELWAVPRPTQGAVKNLK